MNASVVLKALLSICLCVCSVKTSAFPLAVCQCFHKILDNHAVRNFLTSTASTQTYPAVPWLNTTKSVRDCFALDGMRQ